MVEKIFKVKDFLKRWNENFMKKLKSKELNCDPQVLSSGRDFKKYFKNIYDLNFTLDYEEIQEKGDYRYALWVSIQEQDFMIKIYSKWKNKCRIIMKTIEDHLEMAKFILNTFIFLFTIKS